jgi:hypothetical protein
VCRQDHADEFTSSDIGPQETIDFGQFGRSASPRLRRHRSVERVRTSAAAQTLAKHLALPSHQAPPGLQRMPVEAAL